VNSDSFFTRFGGLNPKSPGLLTAAVIDGFVVNPVWFIWLGLISRQSRVNAAPVPA
jgi:hypothetical protein